MYSVFVDDAQQKKPTRPGLEPLVATGGVVAPGNAVAILEKQIEDTCDNYRLSTSDEFKWSPGREKNHSRFRALANPKRTEFFERILSLAKQSEVEALVIISNIRSKPVVNYLSDHKFATFAALLERINMLDSYSIVISDQPGGGPRNNKKLLDNCKRLITKGTPFQDMKKISINVVTTLSRYNRLLQLADVVTSCTLSYISGENKHSPPLFKQHIIPLVRRHNARYGGAGIKIHPAYLYVNLYHWLLGDKYYTEDGRLYLLPIQDRPYSDSPTIP